MDAAAAARRWARVWEDSWPTADVEAIAALYAGDAAFYSHPFRARRSPEDYVRSVFADQGEAECRFGEPLVHDDRAAVDSWGVVRSRDGSVETIAGISLLRLAPDGLVVEQRDAWSGEPGRIDLRGWASTT